MIFAAWIRNFESSPSENVDRALTLEPALLDQHKTQPYTERKAVFLENHL
jgi:hypothetical protein